MKFKVAIALAGLLLCSGAGRLSAGWIDNGAPLCVASGEQQNPRIVSDGAGGAIVVWEDWRNFNWDIYAQRISSTGETLWDPNGIAVCAASADQLDPQLIPDGSGGAFVTWYDLRNGTRNHDIYAQKISPDGRSLWAVDGAAVCTEPGVQYDPVIAPDDSGGVIVAWLDNRVLAQRISADGKALWDSTGVVISTRNNARAQIIADGSRGAIIVSETAGSSADLYAQKISSGGIVQWKANGVTVCAATQGQSRPQLISDGAGGAIIAWMDFRASAWDIYAQRISDAGAARWAANGIAICTAENDQTIPGIISDGAGGAIISWVDGRGGDLDISAQRASGTGAVLWHADGVPVCTAPFAQQEVEMVPDGAGGAIIAWTDGRASEIGDIYAQRMSPQGMARWTLDGVAVCTATGPQAEPAITADGYGGAIVAWQDARSGSPDIYAQKIRFNGAITAVEGNRVPAMRAELLPLSPNPFSGGVALRFSVETPGGVALKVFDVRGRLVRDLGRRWAAAGSHSIAWNCRDDADRRVGSGVYFIQMEAGAAVATRKAVVLE